jgi:hypothetical protein
MMGWSFICLELCQLTRFFMRIKTLLTLAGLTEIGIGILLMLVPSAVTEILLGVPLEGAALLALGRICGAGLFCLGLACWLAPHEDTGGTARSLHTAMLAYNLLAVIVFVGAALHVPTAGIVLWLAIGWHTILTAWFMFSYKRFN